MHAVMWLMYKCSNLLEISSCESISLLPMNSAKISTESVRVFNKLRTPCSKGPAILSELLIIWTPDMRQLEKLDVARISSH